MQTNTEGSGSSYSNPEPDAQGSFTLVTRKNKKNRKNRKGINNSITKKKITPEEKLEKTLSEMRSDSKWLESCIHITCDAVASLSAPAEIQSVLCLGLGSPTESEQARFQLCLLLELRDTILPDQVRIEAFDPVFTREDKRLLTSLGIQISKNDKQGKHDLEIEGLTLAYMPHCDRQLYENFLRTNCRPDLLSNFILIGNDLREYVERFPSEKLGKECPCISRLAPLLASTPLPPHSIYPIAFSSTAAQHINTESLTNDFLRDITQLATTDVRGSKVT